jgi:hypothetical protein
MRVLASIPREALTARLVGLVLLKLILQGASVIQSTLCCVLSAHTSTPLCYAFNSIYTTTGPELITQRDLLLLQRCFVRTAEDTAPMARSAISALLGAVDPS